MGMFDYIKFEMKCPNCNTKIDGFQSKDGACMMDVLEFYEVDNFYHSCPNCNTWVEYTLEKRPNREINIKDYKEEIKIPTVKEQKAHKRKYEELAKLFRPKNNALYTDQDCEGDEK